MFALSKKVFVATLFAGLFYSAPSAYAAYPEKPVMVIVPFAAGGGTDIIARSLQKPLGQALGSNVVVKNTAGAGGTIGLAEVARAKPDGYTIGLAPVGPLTTQPHLKNLPYKDDSFEYVCLAYSAPTVIAVRKDSEFKTLKDLIDYAKNHEGGITFAIPAIGSLNHIAGLALAKDTGIDITYLPVKGDAPSLQTLLNGTAQMFMPHVSFLSSHQSQIKALAVLQDERIAELPNLPTAKEQGYNLNFPIWGGLVVPKGTPKAVVTKLDQSCHTALTSDHFEALLKKLHEPSVYMNSTTFTNFVAKQYQRNGQLLKKAGLAEK